MKINWEKYFDKIYCIHYLPFKDRYESLCNELDYVDILDSPIFEWKNILNNDKILEIIEKSDFNKYNKSKGLISSVLGHYDIWNEIIFYNYKHTLILEDDILFRKNKNHIIEILNNLPYNYDVCLYDYLFENKENVFDYNLNININDLNTNYYGIYNRGFLVSCYSISNRFAKWMIDIFPYYDNSTLNPADWYISPNENLNMKEYINNYYKCDYKTIYSKYPLAIQNDEYTSNSLIEYGIKTSLYKANWVCINDYLKESDFKNNLI